MVKKYLVLLVRNLKIVKWKTPVPQTLPLHLSPSLPFLYCQHARAHTQCVFMQPWAWLDPSTILTMSWQQSTPVWGLSLPIKIYPPSCSTFPGLRTEMMPTWRKRYSDSIVLSTCANHHQECHGPMAWLTQTRVSLAGCQEDNEKISWGQETRGRGWQFYHHIESLLREHSYETPWISFPCVQALRIAYDRVGYLGVPRHEPPEVREKHLSCFSGQKNDPFQKAAQTSMPWWIGEGSSTKSLGGFLWSNFCPAPDLTI